ncbi:helicase-related protein [Arcobacter sp. FWKO B]|uniref:helicase-related protein n=1 Tax=Arcobacter sp. FWKO B TaxID=2593672 RepID=UPI0018A62B15|nr:helicase-related protein [Arcobacter sp. FWKO B]QOG12185.1 RNA helicase [Arcobacter sp. FWKO B]
MINKWQEELKKLLNCDLAQMYPTARKLNRRLHFFVGPTNSGKTYEALSHLKKADCGTYLAPLRLLALEGYEELKKSGVKASLITGEEEIFDEDGTHISSTIEMISYDLVVDVCVIDEVQMLEDDDRGWAWVNAILGAPAYDVYMTGSVNALDAVKKIASYLGEELIVKKFQRKNELILDENFTSIKKLHPKTALIAFSRADVLSLKAKLSKKHTVSVIYGNLSPEVRKEEARRFRDGQSDILIATDAIAMGLNLPIKTLLFTTAQKFDGKSRRLLSTNEIVQIAGRAGRYGHHEQGHIGATDKTTLDHIKYSLSLPIKTIKPPFRVKATTAQIESLSAHIKSKNLFDIALFYAKHMKFSGPFVAANISSMLEATKLIENVAKEMSLETKYILSQAPISTKSPLVRNAFIKFIEFIKKQKIVYYRPSIEIYKHAKDEDELLKAEDEIRKISLYLWLSYKFPDLFVDAKKAISYRGLVNQFIENSLKIGIKRKKTFEYSQNSTKKRDEINKKQPVQSRPYKRKAKSSKSSF